MPLSWHINFPLAILFETLMPLMFAFEAVLPEVQSGNENAIAYIVKKTYKHQLIYNVTGCEILTVVTFI